MIIYLLIPMMAWRVTFTTCKDKIMMPNRTAEEMRSEYGSRLTQDQRDFLDAFIYVWEFVDRHGRDLGPLDDIYDHWLNTQILEGQKSDAEFLKSLEA